MKIKFFNIYSIALFQVFALLLINIAGSGQSVAINSTGNAPDGSAALDIQSTVKGMLIPRISLSALNSAAPLTNPATSLMIYNTNTLISGGAGYYFNAGSPGSPRWVKVVVSDTADFVEDDLRVTIDKGSNAAQLGSLTGINGPEIWFFRNDQGVEAMSFTLQLPHNWKEGTTIYPHIHWVPRASGSGNIKWNLDYSWAQLDEISPVSFPATSTLSNVVTGPFTINKHMMSPLSAGNTGIDGSGKSVSSILICRIWRDSGDPADTFQADAGGLSIDFHIQIKNVFR